MKSKKAKGKRTKISSSSCGASRFRLHISYRPETPIEMFGAKHNLTLHVEEREADRPNYRADNRYHASFPNVEVKDGIFLRSVFGDGDTVAAALKDYCGQLSSKCIVIDAMLETRRELDVPKLL